MLVHFLKLGTLSSSRETNHGPSTSHSDGVVSDQLANEKLK